MKNKYLLLGRSEEHPYNLHTNQANALKQIRKLAKYRPYWVDKRIYIFKEEVE